MNPHNFFAELKRRNVYKVAVAYAIVGWLLIQIATQVFPPLSSLRKESNARKISTHSTRAQGKFFPAEAVRKIAPGSMSL